MAWIEILSQGEGQTLRATEAFLDRFAIDEIDMEIASRAASLRRRTASPPKHRRASSSPRR